MTTPMTGWGSRGAAGRDRARQAILEAALRLFAERGDLGVRVEDIAREAGISRATFYKHFAERDEILASLFERLLGATGEVGPPADGQDPEATILGLLVDTADRMLSDEVLARFVYRLPIRHDAVLPGGAAVPPVFDHVRSVLDEARAAGRVRDDVSLDRAVEVIGRAYESAVRDWAEGRVEHPRARLEEALHLVFAGLGAA